MKDGKCPKCNSSKVFKNTNGLVMGGHRNTLEIYTAGGSSKGAACDNYICTNCGYFENYIVAADILNEVNEKWSKVG